MSTKDEKTKAITYTRDFLRRLINPKDTPKVPKWIRREAYYRLKHYPADYEVEVKEPAPVPYKKP